jgi:mono/diheme cytochrome c family protein
VPRAAIPFAATGRGPGRLALLLALACTLALAAAGCGGNGDGTTTAATTTEPAATATEPTGTETTDSGPPGAPRDGATVFAEAGCGTCHTFAEAGSTGTTGPSLDSSVLTKEQVEGQVRFPSGPMPSFSDQLSDEEISAVAEYVVDNRTG